MVRPLCHYNPKTRKRIEEFILNVIREKGGILNTDLQNLISQHIPRRGKSSIHITRQQLGYIISRLPEIGKEKIYYYQPRRKARTLYFWRCPVERVSRVGHNSSTLDIRIDPISQPTHLPPQARCKI